MYAIVRAGGRQEKVGTRMPWISRVLSRKPLPSLALPVLLIVDGAAVTSDPAVLANATCTAEIVDHHRGPKIDILKYKNKTGYRRRQGHRQDLTAVKVTDITPGK